jgi:hypothetical protein
MITERAVRTAVKQGKKKEVGIKVNVKAGRRP